MFDSLKTTLMEVVSNEEAEVQLTDGETKLETIEGTEPTVSEVKKEFEEAELKVKEVEDDIATVAEATSAMEAYIDILKGAQEDGGLNSQAAAILRVGIERYETLFGLQEPLTPAVEAFGGSMSQRRATDIALESLEGMVVKAKAIREKLEGQLKELTQ